MFFQLFDLFAVLLHPALDGLRVESLIQLFEQVIVFPFKFHDQFGYFLLLFPLIFVLHFNGVPEKFFQVLSAVICKNKTFQSLINEKRKFFFFELCLQVTVCIINVIS
ncbi:MAG: hypothetical protein CVV44_20130 [Spirochaetae bacterium HGW-Spirochaetae-1]|nr:MAG: hypothetical protein CVV44_20130 [Spirochaetae bacterium HGW-Spirochaetae-1]